MILKKIYEELAAIRKELQNIRSVMESFSIKHIERQRYHNESDWKIYVNPKQITEAVRKSIDDTIP